MMRHRAGWYTALGVILAACASNAEAQKAINNLTLSDYTGDMVVDGLDYLVWRNSFGDFNQDHVIDAGDYILWRQNFASSSGASEDRFNGSTLGQPVPADALLAWRSVPLQGLFDTPSGYNAWVNRLTSQATLPGDYNADSVVDAADYTVWRNGLLAVATQSKFLALSGDYNDDGVVDARDYALWRDNLGAPANLNTPSGFVAGDFDTDGNVDAADYTVWRDGLGGGGTFSLDADGATPPGGVVTIVQAGDDWAWLIDPDTVFNPSLLGDANRDGFVGINDLNLVLSHWNKFTPPASYLADVTGDGFVGIADLNAVLGDWNRSIGPAGDGAAVPEPASLGLLVLGVAGCVRRRSRCVMSVHRLIDRGTCSKLRG